MHLYTDPSRHTILSQSTPRVQVLFQVKVEEVGSIVRHGMWLIKGAEDSTEKESQKYNYKRFEEPDLGLQQ